MEDTAVYKTIAGRMPYFPERERWKSLMGGARLPVLVAAVGLVLFFALSAIGGATEGSSLFVGLAAVIGFGVAILFFLVFRRDGVNRMKTRWYDEQADRRRLSAGCTVEFCGDRLVYTDLRSRTVIPYNGVTACFETVDGFLFTADTSRILVRSYDLTAADCQWIRQWVYPRLPQGTLCIKQTAVAQLASPLPILGFCNEDTVLFRGTFCGVSPFVYKRFKRIATLLVIPASLVAGALIATVVSLGNSFLDVVLFSAGVAAAAILLLSLLVIALTKPVTVQLAFTVDGVAWHHKNTGDFVVWQRIKRMPRRNGVRLWFYDGTCLFLPFKKMDNPDAARRLFINSSVKGDRPNG